MNRSSNASSSVAAAAVSAGLHLLPDHHRAEAAKWQVPHRRQVGLPAATEGHRHGARGRRLDDTRGLSPGEATHTQIYKNCSKTLEK